MKATGLKCVACGAGYGLEPLYVCARCGGTFDVVYDGGIAPVVAASADTRQGVWRYAERLPVDPSARPVSLGEGRTPLISAERWSVHPGVRLFLKNETANPTLSFKDRPMSVALTVAQAFGMERIVAASTGNTAVSAAAYAARAGLPLHLFVPEDTPPEKLRLMQVYGARLEKVPGTFSEAYARARRVSEENKAFNVTSTFINAYACEGDKTLAYEIAEQLGYAPDWVTVPIGAGPLLAYALKGFEELRAGGRLSKTPRMVGVQAARCAPIARAFEAGSDTVTAWTDASDTMAGGVADPLRGYPEDGTRTLRAIRASGGCALGIEESDIARHVRGLAREEGIFAEPAAALATAAVERLHVLERIRPGETVVAVITGHGIKDADAMAHEILE